MNRLLEFLFKNPILLFVLVAWVAGMIGNARRAAQRRRQAPPIPTARPSTPAGDPAERRSAEEVAREMRRILGMEEAPAAPPPPMPEPKAPVVVRRNAAEPERPPVVVVPSTQNRRLQLHEASHVGERMQQRGAPHGSRKGPPAGADRDFGSLGGRVHASAGIRRDGRRLVDLADLKRSFVMNEILGKPLALRSRDEQL